MEVSLSTSKRTYAKGRGLLVLISNSNFGKVGKDETFKGTLRLGAEKDFTSLQDVRMNLHVKYKEYFNKKAHQIPQIMEDLKLLAQKEEY